MDCTCWFFGFHWLTHIIGPDHITYFITAGLIRAGCTERLLSFDVVTCLQKVKKVQPVQLSIGDLNGHGAAQCFEKDLVQICINDSSK
jgi:L-aminopeptidase/D-esterase-like protein